MSVINSVLKDLDNKESAFTPIEVDLVSSARPRETRLHPWLLGGMCSVLLLVSGGWYALQQEIPAESASISMASGAEPIAVLNPIPAAEAAVIDTQPEAEPVIPPLPANQIIGLQIRETEAQMRLEFALRGRVVAYLSERSENSFGYHLRDIESRIVAPLLRDNPWIVTFDIETRDGGVDVNFATADDILVETRQQKIDEEFLWSISLTRPVSPAEAESLPEPVSPTVSPVSESVPADPEPVAMVEPEEAAPKEATTVEPEKEVKLDIRSTNPQAKTDNQLSYAVELINSRRYSDAENLLQDLLDGALDLKAREHLLALYALQKQPDRFRSLLRESMARHPQSRVFVTEYARSLFQDSAYTAVIELLTAQSDRDAAQHALLATSHQRLDQHDEAVTYFRLALQQEAANAKHWIALGISLEHTAALDEALDSYRTASRLGNLSNRLRAFVGERSATLQQVLN